MSLKTHGSFDHLHSESRFLEETSKDLRFGLFFRLESLLRKLSFKAYLTVCPHKPSTVRGCGSQQKQEYSKEEF